MKRQVSRRKLMTWLGLGLTLAMTMLALIEAFKTEMENMQHEVPLHITIMLVFASSAFVLFHGIGFNVIPMLLIGELCPIKLKSITSSLALTWVALMIFIVVKMFPIAMGYVGASATYTFFGAICMGGTLFSHFFVPDTQGKSVHEIQNMYNNSDENENL